MRRPHSRLCIHPTHATRLVAYLLEHSDGIFATSVLGDTAVTGSADTTLKVWDLKRIPRDPDGGFPAFEDEDEGVYNPTRART